VANNISIQLAAEIRNFNQLIYELPKYANLIGEEFFGLGNYTGDILGHLTAVGEFQGNCITSQSGLADDWQLW
jgi:hypothetical protein